MKSEFTTTRIIVACIYMMCIDIMYWNQVSEMLHDPIAQIASIEAKFIVDQKLSHRRMLSRNG